MENEYHSSLQKLPLGKFIDCDVDGNLNALVISGDPGFGVLVDAWEDIKSEFADLTGSNEYKMYLRLFKEISLLKSKIARVDIIAARGNGALGVPTGILRMEHVPFYADELNILIKNKPAINFNWEDQKSYTAALDKCINRSAAMRMQYDLKNLEFEAIKKKHEGNGKEKPQTTRQYYTSVLVTLSDFAKFHLDETILMPEYCERLRRYAEYEKSNTT